MNLTEGMKSSEMIMALLGMALALLGQWLGLSQEQIVTAAGMAGTYIVSRGVAKITTNGATK